MYTGVEEVYEKGLVKMLLAVRQGQWMAVLDKELVILLEGLAVELEKELVILLEGLAVVLEKELMILRRDDVAALEKELVMLLEGLAVVLEGMEVELSVMELLMARCLS